MRIGLSGVLYADRLRDTYRVAHKYYILSRKYRVGGLKVEAPYHLVPVET